MNRNEYKDYQYVMVDTSYVYLGGKYTYQDLMEQENVPFKIKAIVEHYIAKEVPFDTSLESHFYFLEEGSFCFRTYQQLRLKIKVSELQEKKSFLGRKKLQYVEHTYKLQEFVQMNLAQKKKKGIVVQEIIFPKLALMSFAV